MRGPSTTAATRADTAAFTWTPVPRAVAYNVYRDHELVKQVSEPKYEEGDRLADATYDYSVTAVNELGVESDESGVLSIQLIG